MIQRFYMFIIFFNCAFQNFPRLYTVYSSTYVWSYRMQVLIELFVGFKKNISITFFKKKKQKRKLSFEKNSRTVL